MTFERLASGIQYRELKGSPQVSFQGEGLLVKRTFETPWDQAWRFALYLLGDAHRVAVTGTDGFGNPQYGIRRTLPDPYSAVADHLPEVRSGSLAWATAIETVDGLGTFTAADQIFTSVKVSDYDVARMTVRYESLNYPILDDEQVVSLEGGSGTSVNTGNQIPMERCLGRFVTRVVQPAAEALTLPHGTFVFTEDQTPILGANLRIVPSTEVHYVWHRVPGRPRAVTQAIGCVNAAEFDGFARGTLLLLAVEVKPYRWLTGRRLCDITYKMKHFSALDTTLSPVREYTPERGHNWFLRTYPDGSSPPTYMLLTHNGNTIANGGQPVYREADFTALFNPSASITSNSDDDALE